MEYEYRAEIISNQSVMDDIVEYIEEQLPNVEYTIVENAQGRGMSSKKLGNTVWPEMNFILFAYTDLDGAKKIKGIMEELKAKFPREGMSWFFTKSETVQLIFMTALQLGAGLPNQDEFQF